MLIIVRALEEACVFLDSHVSIIIHSINAGISFDNGRRPGFHRRTGDRGEEENCWHLLHGCATMYCVFRISIWLEVLYVAINVFQSAVVWGRG